MEQLKTRAESLKSRLIQISNNIETYSDLSYPSVLADPNFPLADLRSIPVKTEISNKNQSYQNDPVPYPSEIGNIERCLDEILTTNLPRFAFPFDSLRHNDDSVVLKTSDFDMDYESRTETIENMNDADETDSTGFVVDLEEIEIDADRNSFYEMLKYRPSFSDLPSLDLPDSLPPLLTTASSSESLKSETVSVAELSQFIQPPAAPPLPPPTIMAFTPQSGVTERRLTASHSAPQLGQSETSTLSLTVKATPDRNNLLEQIRRSGGAASLKSLKRAQAPRIERESFGSSSSIAKHRSSAPQADIISALSQALSLRRKGLVAENSIGTKTNVTAKEDIENKRRTPSTATVEDEDWR